MAYDGYVSFAGEELANRARLNAYMSAYMPGILKSCDCDCDDLPAALGHYGYSTPFGDEAPWVDKDDEDSADFYGVMVNSMRGIDDGVREVSFTQSTRTGGAISGGRSAVREVRFVMTAYAGTEAGLNSGWRWIKTALEAACEDPCAGNSQLCFFSSCPTVGEPIGAHVSTRILGNNLVPETGTWDGKTFIPTEGTVLLTQSYPGYFDTEELTEDPEGYYLGLDVDSHLNRSADGYFHSESAHLNTPPLDRPINCGEASWTFSISGSGVVVVEAIVDGEVASRSRIELTEEPQQVFVTEGGRSETMSDSYARITAGEGTEVTVHDVQEIRNLPSEPGQDCSDALLRTIHDCTVISGPKVMWERDLSNGGWIRQFEFVVAAMSPHIYGQPIEVASMLRGWTKSMRGASIAEWNGPLAACEPVEDVPLLDPYCLPLAPLPEVPSIPLGCGDIPAEAWEAAYLVEIPEHLLKMWTDSVPVLTLVADEEIRGVRVRFFPRPVPEWGMSNIDPCSACGTFEVSYVPQGCMMTIDGMNQRIVVEEPGGRVRQADHLVSSGDNEHAFVWPELSCGVGYFLLVETAETTIGGLSLRLATKE